jgi:hypothetical protein
VQRAGDSRRTQHAPVRTCRGQDRLLVEAHFLRGCRENATVGVGSGFRRRPGPRDELRSRRAIRTGLREDFSADFRGRDANYRFGSAQYAAAIYGSFFDRFNVALLCPMIPPKADIGTAGIYDGVDAPDGIDVPKRRC